jgi:integrase
MVNGEPIQRTTGHTTYKSALRRYHEIITELSNTKSGWTKPESITLNAWWLLYRAAKKKSPKTWKREEDIMRLHVLPDLGKSALSEVTPNQMERHFARRRRSDAATGTLTREQSLVTAIFNAAIESDFLDRNPMKSVARVKYATRKRVITPGEQAKVQAVLSRMLTRWLTFMLGTGLRLGDIKGINPSTDINWETRIITVTGKGHNGEAKTRDVPLLDPQLDVLLREQIAENEAPNIHARMDRRGTLWAQEGSYFRKELTKACKKAGVAFFSPHILRHTFATRYLQGGGDIYTLSKILGHSSVKVTETVYAHLLGTDLGKLSKHVELGLDYQGLML